MDFRAAILKLAIMINYESSIANLDLSGVSQPNGTAHGEFCAETACWHKLYAKK